MQHYKKRIMSHNIYSYARKVSLDRHSHNITVFWIVVVYHIETVCREELFCASHISSLIMSE